ncbi:MAG: SUMF1/EgtB/PvdO family nonheme iron enzyme [Verrucomicrobiales bacterium]|nr:SUMF1/EgtB/PvdO family nonheme iron enzyme [Verrucomicrobiales bacterium]
MVLIPAGTFQMGGNLNDGGPDELPVHSVYVSSFFMDRSEVSRSLYDEVYQWATNHNYAFERLGLGEAGHHPVQGITWFDAMKWCNARSEKEGRTPAYRIGPLVYRTGSEYPSVDWRNGYRLPTEAEWEKAARGGLRGMRFPFGNTIAHSQANYNSRNDYAYDVSPTVGYHPSCDGWSRACTTPGQYFPDNGYGLYGMAGNVGELCWDFYEADYYTSSPVSDPRGPPWGAYAVIRGGGWYEDASMCRVANRHYRFAWGGDISSGVGFRCVLP